MPETVSLLSQDALLLARGRAISSSASTCCAILERRTGTSAGPRACSASTATRCWPSSPPGAFTVRAGWKARARPSEPARGRSPDRAGRARADSSLLGAPAFRALARVSGPTSSWPRPCWPSTTSSGTGRSSSRPGVGAIARPRGGLYYTGVAYLGKRRRRLRSAADPGLAGRAERYVDRLPGSGSPTSPSSSTIAPAPLESVFAREPTLPARLLRRVPPLSQGQVRGSAARVFGPAARRTSTSPT